MTIYDSYSNKRWQKWSTLLTLDRLKETFFYTRLIAAFFDLLIQKTFAKNPFFAKCLFWGIYAICHIPAVYFFFRKCVFSGKNLRDLRKMSTFASEEIGVSKHGFSQKPWKGNNGFIICENFQARNCLVISNMCDDDRQKPEHLTLKNDGICEISVGKRLYGWKTNRWIIKDKKERNTDCLYTGIFCTHSIRTRIKTNTIAVVLIQLELLHTFH